MDNITHSLAGLVLAESALRLRARRRTEPSSRLRAVAAGASLMAANLPDLDLVYSGAGADRLAYMLHHRGHTHTVVVALLGAILLWVALLLAWRRRARTAPLREEAGLLLALLVASVLSHLALDWTNSYGVHPFWPLDNRWRYGDAVFIIEPWLWVAAVPMLVASAPRRLVRALLSLILLGGLALAWRIDIVAAGAATALTVGAAASVVLARILRPDARTAVAVLAWMAVTLVMATGAAVARDTVRRSVRAADPAADLLDIVVTPLPANPVCATVITVERSGTLYRVATARVSAAPRISEASDCPARGGAGPTFRISSRRSEPEVRWDEEWTAPHAEIAGLARESCPALAALRFIRVPIWRADTDSTVMLGDARYGGASGNGFSDVRVPRTSVACPHAVPPWTPPRTDVLGIPATGRG